MGVLILLPAMPKAPGPFRRAILAARERSDDARAVCVMSEEAQSFDPSGAHDVAEKVAQGMAQQQQERAELDIAALEKLAMRCGLELSTSIEIGELPDVARDLVRASTAQHLVLIRPRSTALQDLVDRTVEVLGEEFDGELLVIE